jgi:hypothetical protein
VDLVAYLARRRDPARLIVIGTYRPVDMVLGDHPLKPSSGNCRRTDFLESCHSGT